MIFVKCWLDPLTPQVFRDTDLGSLAAAGLLGHSVHRTKIKASVIKSVG